MLVLSFTRSCNNCDVDSNEYYVTTALIIAFIYAPIFKIVFRLLSSLNKSVRDKGEYICTECI